MRTFRNSEELANLAKALKVDEASKAADRYRYLTKTTTPPMPPKTDIEALTLRNWKEWAKR